MSDPPVLRWDQTAVSAALTSVARYRRLTPDQVDDWVGEASLWLVRYAGHHYELYRRQASERTYLTRLLKNHCTDWLRRQDRIQRSIPLHNAQGLVERLSKLAWHDPLVAAENARERDRQLGRLSRMIAGLTDAQRLLLLEYVARDSRMPEIARRLSITFAVAHSRLRRALTKLRRLMGVFGPADPVRPRKTR